MIFDTGVSKYDYREVASDRGMVVLKDDSVWVPVEITLAGEPFLRAWQEGARQYNKCVMNNEKVGIYPAAQAWEEYVPVTLEEFGWEPEVPQKQQIAALYDKDIKSLVGSELDRKVLALQKEINQDPHNPKLYNKLGITYARYGKYRGAITAFEKVCDLRKEYSPAYNNLGNVYYLLGEYQEALSYYKKALNYSDSPLILINMAKTIYKLGDYKKAKEFYLSAVEKNQKFKEKYAYLGTAASQELRASARAEVDVMVEWYNE